MSRKTIIFFPIDIGLAHIARSLAVAEALEKRGFKAIMALPKEKIRIFKISSVTFTETQAMSTFDDFSVVKKLMDPDYLMLLAREEIALIKKYRPDALVVDTRVSALASAIYTKLPIIYISSSTTLPTTPYISNPGVNPLLYFALSPIFQLAISHVKKRYFCALNGVIKNLGGKAKVEDMFGKMLYIIPEVPNYVPSNDNPKSSYVGSIHWKGFQGFVPNWLHVLDSTKPTVYLTFGGTGFDKKKFISLANLLIKKNYQVIVTTGTIAKPEEFPKMKNLYVERFVSGDAVLKYTDVAVCHGGYGTLTQALEAGVPTVSIPFNPDQLFHSARFQELGLGRGVFRFGLKIVSALLRFDWPTFLKESQKIDPEIVVKTVDQVLTNKDKYKKSIAQFNKNSFRGDGAEKAAKLIDEFIIKLNPILIAFRPV